MGIALASIVLALVACGGDHVITDGDEVTLNYVGTLDDGSEFDSSIQEGREPFSFTVGAGQVIDGFDAAVRGMRKGEEKTFRLDPEDAYGNYTQDRIIEVAVADLPEDIAVGDQLYDGFGQLFEILAIEDGTATMDGNHPLAGQALTFTITIVDAVPGA